MRLTRVSSGGMHIPIEHGEGKNAFVSSLRDYGLSSSPLAMKSRRRSNSPKKDFLLSTMTAFSNKYKKQMKEIHDYQKKLDERLSKPKKSSSPKKSP